MSSSPARTSGARNSPVTFGPSACRTRSGAATRSCVTYDFQFDASGATLPVGGIHTVDVERETGSVAITTAASLQLNAKSATDSLRRVDEAELSAADRSLITRAVVLAYQYTGDQYDLSVDVKRYAEQRVLEAVADRTQITSVLTESGQMLTQASFMVKNNEKQFQQFELPSLIQNCGAAMSIPSQSSLSGMVIVCSSRCRAIRPGTSRLPWTSLLSPNQRRPCFNIWEKRCRL